MKPTKIILIGTLFFFTIFGYKEMSWLEGWGYRQSIPINGSPDGQLTDFQRKLIVKKKVGVSSPGEIYLNNHCRDDFGDIRFTNSDGETELKYFIEDIQAHFSNLGCSAPLYPNISPVAIYYGGKTYVVFQGSDLHPFITTYTHATGIWATPVQVGTNPLSGDDHGVPNLLRDAAGYWHVFFGCHNGVIKHSKSNDVDDISAWTAQADVASSATYPCPILASNSDIYLFYRKNIGANDYPEYFVKSTDNGASWGAETLLIDFSAVSNRVYPGNFELELGTPEKIHFAWSYSDSGDSWRRNVYHAYLVISGGDAGKCFNMGGTDLGASITKTEADASCLVYNSGTNNCSFPKTHVYSGIPHIIFPLDNGTNPQSFQHTKWNGFSWDSPTTINAVPSHVRYGGYVDFIINGTSDIEAYFVVSAEGYGNRGGTLERWLWDGSWAKDKVVLPAFEWDGLVNPWIVKDHQADLKVIFSENYLENYVDGLRLFAYGDDGIKASVDIQASVLIKLDSIPINPGTADFYIYYGKSDALITSSGVNTYDFFDHFLGTSLDTEKWNNNTNAADTLVVLNNELHWSIADAGAARAVPGIDSKSLTFSLPLVIESRWRVKFLGPTGGVTTTAVRFLKCIHPTANTNCFNETTYFAVYHIWYDNTTNDWLNILADNGGSANDNDLINNLRIRESIRFKTTLNKEYRNEVLELSDTHASVLASGYLGLQYYIDPGSAIGTQEIFIDFIAIRKYTDNEPAWGTPGEEEIYTITPIAITSAEIHGVSTISLISKPSAIASIGVFGTSGISLISKPVAIESLESIGISRPNLLAYPSSINTAELHGSPSLNFIISLLSIATGESLGVSAIKLKSIVQGIESGEAFGLIRSALIVMGLSSMSEEIIGFLKLLLTVFPISILRQEAFGYPLLRYSEEKDYSFEHYTFKPDRILEEGPYQFDSALGKPKPSSLRTEGDFEYEKVN